MTVEWNRTVTEVVWESQTAPGITWTTVVGGTGGGTEIPARRLLPNTVGTPGQIPAVNEAGTAVEYVDAPSGGGSFPTYSSAIADRPTDPSTGESWVPSDAPGVLFWDGTEWAGAIFNVDGDGNLGGLFSTPSDGTAIMSGRGRYAKMTDSGLEFGSVASIYAANIDPSVDGWAANTGSLLLSSAALWRKTGSADTDWAMIGGDSHWSVNGSGGLTPADNLSLAGQKIYFNSEADPNHVMGPSDTLNGPEIRGYADVGVYVGDTENDAATLVGRFHADGLEVDHGDGPAEVIAHGDGAGGGLSGTFPNPGLNASSVQSLVLAYLAAGANISLAVNGGGDLVISVTGLVADAINDGTTTVAPSQNAVFDALAAKIANPGGSNDDFLQRKAGVYTNRTIAQVKTDLGVVTPVWTLIEERILGANSALETFSSLTGYTQFLLTVEGRSTATGVGVDGLLVRLNADAGSNYAFSRQGWYDTTTDTSTGGSSQSSIAAGFLAGSQTNTNRRGMVTAQIMQKTGGFLVLKSEYVCGLSNYSNAYGGRAHGSWASATSISSLSVFLASGSIASGAVIRLEGRA